VFVVVYCFYLVPAILEVPLQTMIDMGASRELAIQILWKVSTKE
jgi:hypothetical protein